MLLQCFSDIVTLATERCPPFCETTMACEVLSPQEVEHLLNMMTDEAPKPSTSFWMPILSYRLRAVFLCARRHVAVMVQDIF